MRDRPRPFGPARKARKVIRMTRLFDCILAGASVVNQDGVGPRDIGVIAGKIAEIGDLYAAAAGERIDCRGLHILPGAIDIHFHIRAPSFPARGTVASETRAAAAGGVTTLFKMPIAKPCCATPEILRARRAHFSGEAVVNFALFGAPNSGMELSVKGDMWPSRADSM